MYFAEIMGSIRTIKNLGEKSFAEIIKKLSVFTGKDYFAFVLPDGTESLLEQARREFRESKWKNTI